MCVRKSPTQEKFSHSFSVWFSIFQTLYVSTVLTQTKWNVCQMDAMLCSYLLVILAKSSDGLLYAALGEAHGCDTTDEGDCTLW